MTLRMLVARTTSAARWTRRAVALLVALGIPATGASGAPKASAAKPSAANSSATKSGENSAARASEKSAAKSAVAAPAVAPAVAPSAYADLGRAELVEWRPWGEEAFHEAEASGRPVLLNLGVMWCHYCRVMSDTTYQDAEVAEVLNQSFVPIKVDADEHPDVDKRFQAALLRTRKIGGWPLTAFLTAEGHFFTGGTYFTAEDGADGKPGLKRAAERVRKDYQEEKKGYHDTAEELANLLLQAASMKDWPGSLQGLPEEVAEGIAKVADPVFGGFDSGSKFPEWPAFLFALERGGEGDQKLLDVALDAMDGMAGGGIRDLLGGGFHRATVDRAWKVPRFEKLAVVNAGLLQLYAEGFRETGVERYQRVATETLDYILKTLSDPSGGFFSAQAADRSKGDDGSTYTWTLDELEKTLSPEQLAVARAAFEVSAEPKVLPGAPRANVLSAGRPLAEIAADAKLSEDKTKAQLAGMLEVLKKARAARPSPPVDRTLYSSTNGIVAHAVLVASRVLDREDARDRALRTLDLFLEKGFDDKTGFARGIRDGVAVGGGLLQDQAFLARALVDAYEATGRRHYLDGAVRALDVAFRRFDDGSSLGLLDQPLDAPPLSMLLVPDRPVQDQLVPGDNAVVVLVEEKLARLTGETAHADRARRLALAFAGTARTYGPNGATVAAAVTRILEPAPVVIVLAGEGEAAGRALADAALASGRAGVAVVRLATKEDLPAALASEGVSRALAEVVAPAALVVERTKVVAAWSDAKALTATLRKSRPNRGRSSGPGGGGTKPDAEPEPHAASGAAVSGGK